MKTIFMLVMGLFLINISCQNKSSNPGTTTATNYYWSNGSCYASNTGQVVNSTLCNSTCNTGMANNGYYWNNNYCYSSSTGQVVNSTLCSNMNNTGTMTTQCNGSYYYNQQLVTCYVSNSSGYTLIEANSARTVYCQ